MAGGSTCADTELKRFLESLVCFVYGQSDELGTVLVEFCRDPGMSDVDFAKLNDPISERLQRQLAAVLMPALPKQMGEALAAQHKPGVYGMILLRAVCAHHYGPLAVKAKLLTAANLCYNEVVPVTQKCDLRERLNAHLRALQYLNGAGQKLGDAMKGVGLFKLVSQLNLQPEIEAARNIHERKDLVWESKDLLELLDKRANEWLLLPSSGKHVAAAAAAGNSSGHVANCHKWMNGDCPKPDCIFKHDPLIKGRSDLIPTCNLIRQKGACDRPACTFNHPKQSAKAARKLAAQLAQQSALVASSPANAPTATQTQEVSELKAMIVGLVQQQHLAAAAIATLSGTPHKSAVPSEHLSSVAAVSTLIHPVSQPASLLNKTNRSLSDPSTVQPPPPVRPRMARIRSKVKAYKAKVKATQQASLKSTLTACLTNDRYSHAHRWSGPHAQQSVCLESRTYIPYLRS